MLLKGYETKSTTIEVDKMETLKTLVSSMLKVGNIEEYRVSGDDLQRLELEDYHRHEYEFAKVRKATEKEKEIYAAYKTLYKYLSKTK